MWQPLEQLVIISSAADVPVSNNACVDCSGCVYLSTFEGDDTVCDKMGRDIASSPAALKVLLHSSY